MTEAGLLIYIMVDSVALTADAVVAAGGKIVQPIGGDVGEITARFADPAGNVIGLYQPPLSVNSPKREIVSTRVINAPRDLVWKAWTNPKHRAQWWGPKRFYEHVSGVRPQTGRPLPVRHARTGRD